MRALGMLAILSSVSLMGCADVCDAAICELEERCPEYAPSRGDDEVCEGESRVVSQCIVDHPSAACAYLYDPVAEMDNDYARCLFPE